MALARSLISLPATQVNAHLVKCQRKGQTMARILIADSDMSFTLALADDCCRQGWEVEATQDGSRLLAKLGVKYYDVLVLDAAGVEGGGLELLRALRARGIQVAVVMVSASAVIEEAVQAIKAGAQEFVKKPMEISRLSYLIAMLLERRWGSPNHLARRLDLFIREHCSHRALCVSQLCMHFKISRRYISRLLGMHLGGSFRRRLRYYRVQEAKRLLESTDLPVYTIAEQCGFNSPGSLSEAFHQQEGLPPKRYRIFYKG